MERKLSGLDMKIQEYPKTAPELDKTDSIQVSVDVYKGAM